MPFTAKNIVCTSIIIFIITSANSIAAEAISIDRGFYRLRIGMTAREVKTLAGVDIPMSCSHQDLSRRTNVASYNIRFNSQGLIWSLGLNKEINKNKLTQKLFNYYSLDNKCHAGRPDEKDKIYSTSVQRGTGRILESRLTGLYATWKDDFETTVALTQEQNEKITYACIKIKYDMNNVAGYLCPYQYAFCPKPVPWSGGSRF